MFHMTKESERVKTLYLRQPDLQGDQMLQECANIII